jgi:hypothetical protein
MCDFLKVNSMANCHQDRATLGRDRATILYAQSLLHTLPMGSNGAADGDALQLGTMFGVDRAKLLLESAGFQEVTIENIPFMDGNVLVKGTKKF